MAAIPNTYESVNAARELAANMFAQRAAEVDRTETYPADNVAAMTKAGLMGMTIPREYGGKGATILETVQVIEEIAKACGTTGRIAVEGNLGAISAIMTYGTPKQKSLAAELVLAGDKPAICITEPGAGSDAKSMTTTAVKENGRYIINGRKHWITGGGVSKLHLIFARVEEANEFKGIAGFIAVRGETKGLTVGSREPTMGIRGMPECEIIFDNMEVAEDMLVAPPGGLGSAFAGLMNAYNCQRLGAATVSLGIAQSAFEHAVRYACEREQFGRQLSEFQGIRWKIADMAIALQSARGLIRSAAENAGAGFPSRYEAAIAKVVAAETVVEITDQALQIYGARGYSRNNPMERLARDGRMFKIAGGTVEILREQIGRESIKRVMS